ncbi:MAG: tetratricopeptide repeat protein [Oscillatoria princeps RMCB-10]|jgi:tetratricopeptide (TPR) repeat protein|nr:tetratricopeptide repeat protein [Oscillatoria princeps RMCB-10]
MNFLYGLPAALIGAAATVALVQPHMAVALEPSEVAAKAKAFTVRIDGPETGSGVIFERNGKTYSVLTNRHVIYTEGDYQITAPDGKKYLVPYSQVRYLADVDVGVLQFTSDESYPTAQLGNSAELAQGKAVYLAGWADPIPGIPEPTYQFLVANITSIAQKAEKGYALVHDNPATPGISGGPVLDANASVVGINGRFTSEASTGKVSGLGIPVQTFLAEKNNWVLPAKIVPVEDFVSQGLQLAKAGKYRESVAEYSKALESNPNNFEAFYRRAEAYLQMENYLAAIGDFSQVLRLNPNSAAVYFYRGFARAQMKDYQEAISDYNEAIRLNPNDAGAHNSRGLARSELKDYQAAIADYKEAIRLSPNFAEAYNNRGVARFNLKDYQAAISDYSEAIRLNPNYDYAYNNRGNARYDLKDYQGARSDYDEAIRLNPNYAYAYNNRGVARFNQKDYQGAISDYNEAIRLNPSYAYAYNNRGNVRRKLEEYKEAIADYDEAIRLIPNYAGAYVNRGNSHRQLGEKQKAIEDFQKAAEIFQQQGRKDFYQKALDLIRELQR